MSAITDTMRDKCRTCLSYFNESNRKCSLMNCWAITSDSGRFQLMKSIMTTCSVTLFTDKEEGEISEPFICMSCIFEMDQMLSFVEKCIRTEAILKEATSVKMENVEFLAKNRSDNPHEVEIKVENFNNEGRCCNDLDVVSCKNNNEELKLRCQDCNKMFSSALSLTFHGYKHAEFKPYTCAICHENFRTLQLIRKHMASEHDRGSYQQYICRQCSEVFTSKDHLILHRERFHRAKKYLCGTCKRTFSSILSLKFHENIHLGQERHSCKFCSKSFSSAAVLRDHKGSAHSRINQFKCHCRRSFNSKKKLELHVESVHEKKEKSQKYSCPDCEKKFNHPHSLKNHLNTHLGIKPFLCNACGASFTALSNFTSHFRRVHSGEKREKQPAVKKYLCHTCGDSFGRASHLQRHTLRKHIPNAEKKHECPVCKKKFLEKSDVKGHLKLHDDVKPFVCDQCSKCFRTSWRLQAHVKRVHLGLRPFECPTCSVKFKTKSHLEKHIRTHTGEKPFPCPHCAYACAEKSNLKKHINIHLKAM